MPFRSRPLKDRLLDKLNVKGPDDCWLVKNTVGRYGRIKLGAGHGRKDIGTHVAAYMVWKGPVPEGMMVCHTCDTPLCCNPRHLFLGTSTDNNRDRQRKGRSNTSRGKSHYNYKHGRYSVHV